MENSRIYRSNENSLIFRMIVYYILGTFEALFALQFIFRLLGSDPKSIFVLFK